MSDYSEELLKIKIIQLLSVESSTSLYGTSALPAIHAAELAISSDMIENACEWSTAQHASKEYE